MLLIVHKFWIGLLCPVLRYRADLVRKGAHCDRDRNALGSEKAELVLPIKPRRRNARIRQPIERDVVENVVSRKPLGLTVEDARDLFIGPNVMIEDPGSEAHR